MAAPKPKTNRRPQPYRLDWPVTPSQWENTDEMFEILFKRISALEDAAVKKAIGTLPTSPATIIMMEGMPGEDGDMGAPGVAGAPAPISAFVSYVPVSTGAEPLVIVSNGAGSVLLTPYTP